MFSSFRCVSVFFFSLVLLACTSVKPGITDRGLSRAIAYLYSGHPERARPELENYLAANSDVLMASHLLEETEGGESYFSFRYYPFEWFAVQLKEEESLFTLAKDYLGDELYFYALARYNDINNSSLVEVGDVIKIPATTEALEYLYMRGQREGLILPEYFGEQTSYKNNIDFMDFLSSHVGEIVKISVSGKDPFINFERAECGPVFWDTEPEKGSEERYLTGTQVCFRTAQGEYFSEEESEELVYEYTNDEQGVSINGTFFVVGQIDRGRFGVWSNGLIPIREMNIF